MSSCSGCGEQVKEHLLKCPGCGTINAVDHSRDDNSIALCDVVSAEHDRVQTGPWDLCFGGEEDNYGIVRTSATLLGGSPGAGKSTLVLQIANQADGEVIYLAAEEALPEIKARADRLNIKNQRNIRMVSAMAGNVSLTAVIEGRPNKPKMVIIDSLNGLVGEDDALQLEVCKLSKQYATRYSCPFLIISHVTKSDAIAGRLSLQHAVDTTLTFFPDPSLVEDGEEPIRVLEVMKNRFGKAGTKCYFDMTEHGLVYIDPSEREEDEEEEAS